MQRHQDSRKTTDRHAHHGRGATVEELEYTDFEGGKENRIRLCRHPVWHAVGEQARRTVFHSRVCRQLPTRTVLQVQGRTYRERRDWQDIRLQGTEQYRKTTERHSYQTAQEGREAADAKQD